MITLFINNYLIKNMEDITEVLYKNEDPIKIEYRFETSDVIEIMDKLPLIARTNDYWIECRASYIIKNSYNNTTSHILALVNNLYTVRKHIREDNLVKI